MMQPSTRKSRQPVSRKLAALLVAFAFIAAACSSSGDDVINLGSEPLAADVEIDDIEFEDGGESVNFINETFEGQPVSFGDLPEGPVVLIFFAAWSPSCIAELPDFETV